MRRINLYNQEAFFTNKDKTQFILLGKEEISKSDFLKTATEAKISVSTKESLPGLWATLGMANDDEILWRGELQFSQSGNERFKGIVKKMVRLIHKAHGLNIRNKAVERFISFKHVEFDFWKEEFTLAEIPELRLTLMVKPTEGALVFYQFGENTDKATTFRYIQPERTDDNFDTCKRDRLTYKFKALPRHLYEEVPGKEGVYRLSASPLEENFVIKTIVFERGCYENSKQIIDFAKKKMFCGGSGKKYCLLKFNKVRNDFETIHSNEIEKEKKTLLLLHGTFGSTRQSFRALFGEQKSKNCHKRNRSGNKTNDWLKNLMTDKGYEQILAFDHPTVTHDAAMNIQLLFKELGHEFRFENDVDIIGTSQGGLLAQYLANYDRKNTKIPVGKVVLVASANGVDYLANDGAFAHDFLTNMAIISGFTGHPVIMLACLFAQHSAHHFMQYPGMQLMCPGSSRLKAIMDTKPANDKTFYLPVADDFDNNVLSEMKPTCKRLFKRVGKIVRPLMTDYNDLVVRTENQFKVPKGYNYYPDGTDFKQITVSAIHGQALDDNYTQYLIRYFLLHVTKPKEQTQNKPQIA